MEKNLFLLALIPMVWCDVSHVLVSTTTEPPGPPRPYAFGYAAGRFPGHIDRTHSEISDGSGIVKGSFSYVDPRHQIRTVDYVADKEGFHPVLNRGPAPLPSDSAVVAAAKQRHLEQYAAIANSHQVDPNFVAVPRDSVSVHNAKVKHFDLYQKIAEEHARLAEERKALELANAATAEPNYVDDSLTQATAINQIRKKNRAVHEGVFYPVFNETLPSVPADSPVVAAAKQKHLEQVAVVATSQTVNPGFAVVPKDSASVYNAKLHHFDLYQKIAAEHAQIGAERKAFELEHGNATESN